MLPLTHRVQRPVWCDRPRSHRSQPPESPLHSFIGPCPPASAAASSLLGTRPPSKPGKLLSALLTHTRVVTFTFCVLQLVGGNRRPTRGSQLAQPLLHCPAGSHWAGSCQALLAPRALAVSLPVPPGRCPVHARPHRRPSSPLVP